VPGLAAAALASIASALPQYVESEPGDLTRELEPGCLAWVGVMVSQNYGGEIVLTPNVGLFHAEVEDALTAILGFQSGPSVVLNLGYVMPSPAPRQWRVTGATADWVAAEVADAVTRFAEPLALACMNLEVLRGTLSEHALDDERLLREPVIAALRGDYTGAQAELAKVHALVDAEADSRTSAARARRSFVAAFPTWAAERFA
jgi:hypothetical protein